MLGRALALDADGPHQDVARKAVREPVQDVADDGSGGRGDDADHLGQEGDGLAQRGVEEPLGLELALALLQELEQCAFAGQLDRLDHDLVARTRGVGGDAPGADDLEPVLGRDREAAGHAAPAHGIDDRALVLEGKIKVARGGALEARDLAPDPHPAEALLEGAFERGADLADRVFGQVMGDGRFRGRVRGWSEGQ